MEPLRPAVFRKGNPIAYTQTQKLDRVQGKAISNQYKVFLEDMHNYLQKFCDSYELWFEIHDNGYLHAHGVIYEVDKVKRYKLMHKIKENIGYSKFKPIEDLCEWRNYCSKDSETMETVLGIKLPVKYMKERPLPSIIKQLEQTGGTKYNNI